MKKMLYSLLRWPLLITGCAQQTFTVQNKPTGGSTKAIYIISSFLELGGKHIDASQNLWQRRKCC